MLKLVILCNVNKRTNSTDLGRPFLDYVPDCRRFGSIRFNQRYRSESNSRPSTADIFSERRTTSFTRQTTSGDVYMSICEE